MAWHNKNTGAYAEGTTEFEENCNEIWHVLEPLGWTKNAVSAICGNFAHEGGMNPWRWESDNVLNYGNPAIATSRTNGYGLAQFTPPGKYILDSRAQTLSGYGPNYSDYPGSSNDGEAQVLFIDQYADYIPTSACPMTYAEFKANTGDPYYLAEVWVRNYERPAVIDDNTKRIRGNSALYVFGILGGIYIKKGVLALLNNKGGFDGNIQRRWLFRRSRNR